MHFMQRYACPEWLASTVVVVVLQVPGSTVANVVFDSVEEVSSLANVPKPCHAMARDPSAGYGPNTYSLMLLTGSEGCVSEGHDKREYMRAGSPSE
jgi:hypothetical protein